MINTIGRDRFDYRTPSKILMPALKGGTVIAGGLLLFNHNLKTPVIGDWLVVYRRTMHRFFRALGGPKFTDRQWMDVGTMSLLDTIGISGFTLVAGRMGFLNGHHKPPPGVDELGPDGPRK